jgi:hypothetical protein
MNVLNPVEGYMQGLKFGEGIQTDRLNRELAENQEGRAQETFAMQKEDRARAIQQQQAAAAARAELARKQKAQAEAGREALISYYEKIKAGTDTSDDLRNAMVYYPDQVATFNKLKNSVSSESLNSQIKLGRQLLYAVNQGEAGVKAAENLLQQRIDASTDDGQRAAFQAELELLRTDPAGFEVNIGMPLSVIDEGFYKFRDDIKGKKDVVKGVSPIGQIAQDVKSGLVPQSVLDSAIKVENAASEGGLTLQQQISEEARLRGEYNKRTEDLVSAKTNFNIIEVSAADQTGAGDIALVTSFMKMLDPGSVVRETEFATAANTGGLLAKLKSTVTKIEDGKFLSVDQRSEFQNLAKKYLEAAQEREAAVQSSYSAIVDNYKLNPVNVFGSSAVSEVVDGSEVENLGGSSFQNFAINPNVIKALEDNPGVTAEAMWKSMTPIQRSAYE